MEEEALYNEHTLNEARPARLIVTQTDSTFELSVSSEQYSWGIDDLTYI